MQQPIHNTAKPHYPPEARGGNSSSSSVSSSDDEDNVKGAAPKGMMVPGQGGMAAG